MAVANYVDSHDGELPPAYIADENGKPMHSWRVLILPFLGDGERVYEQYDFTEPWNGPNNRKLADKWKYSFFCPSDSERSPHSTSYVAVVGPETAWPGERKIMYEDIVDGLDKTILIVEVENSGIHWMEPRDLTFDELVSRSDGKVGLTSAHKKFVQIGTVNGAVKSLDKEKMNPEALRAMLTINGGEPVQEFSK